MARVSHDEADVVQLGEPHCGLHVGSARGPDGVVNIVAQLARRRPVGKGVAALVGKVRLHDGRRGLHAAVQVSHPRRHSTKALGK